MNEASETPAKKSKAEVDFIRGLVIRRCPSEADAPGVIRHAQQLWAVLTKEGCGDKPKPEKSAKPRALKDDEYGRLSARQREWFDRFWRAFKHTAGKQRAAMTWAKLGDAGDAEYQRIVDAAKKEAERDRAGAARKGAEGWLNDRRYDDFVPTQAEQKQQQSQGKQRLLAELADVKRLYGLSKNDHLLPQIQKLEAAINGLERAA